MRTTTAALWLGGAALIFMAANEDNGCAPAEPQRGGEGVACEASTDCGGDPGVDCTGRWLCVSGQCDFQCGSEPPPPPPPPPAGCYSDDDCRDDQTCNAADVCLPPPGCTPDGVCPDVCYGECVPAQPPPPPPTACTSTANCRDGEYCTTEDGDCDSNCPDGMVCPAVCWGTCKPVPQTRICYADSECAWGEFCDRDPCVFPDMSPADGEQARIACGGVCSPLVTCASDRDCADHEYCGCAAPPMGQGLVACFNQCLPREGACASDADCPDGHHCQSGVCTEGREECWSNEECPRGWSCEASCDVSGDPFAGDPSESDADFRPAPCPSYCVPPSGETCADTGVQCGPNERCEDVCWTICPDCDCAGNDCVCPCWDECTSSCVPTGEPVTCSSDRECGDGAFCDFSNCWTSSDDGSAERPMCLGECREVAPPDYDCKDDSHCVAPDGQLGTCDFQVCEVWASPECDPSGQSCDPQPPETVCHGFCRYEEPPWCNPWEDNACPDGFRCQSDCDASLPNGLIFCPSRCVLDEPAPTECIRTGCSGQVCASEDVATTCEWYPWYGCYADALCEVQADGACGWTRTDAYAQCMTDEGAYPD